MNTNEFFSRLNNSYLVHSIACICVTILVLVSSVGFTFCQGFTAKLPFSLLVQLVFREESRPELLSVEVEDSASLHFSETNACKAQCFSSLKFNCMVCNNFSRNLNFKRPIP